MPKFPEPPPAAELAARAVIVVVPAGALWWRVYPQAGPYPGQWDTFRAYGPVDARFDPHLPPPRVQERAILYAAASGPTCLAEVFQHTRCVHRERNAPALAGFVLARGVRLVDLREHATRVGASTALSSGPHARAQRWARAIWEALPHVDGLLYGAALHGHAPAYALFERARAALPAHPVVHRRLDDPLLHTLVANAAADLGYGVL